MMVGFKRQGERTQVAKGRKKKKGAGRIKGWGRVRKAL